MKVEVYYYTLNDADRWLIEIWNRNMKYPTVLEREIADPEMARLKAERWGQYFECKVFARQPDTK